MSQAIVAYRCGADIYCARCFGEWRYVRELSVSVAVEMMDSTPVYADEVTHSDECFECGEVLPKA